MSDEVVITGRVISRVYPDGTSTDYKLELDQNTIYIKQGEGWISFPVHMADTLIEAIGDLQSSSTKRVLK